jgi:hypothetical protein
MSWDDVDNKHKKHTDSKFVACEEDYEINYIVKIIKEEFSWLSDVTIRSAIAQCCMSIKAPRPRDKFMECLKSKLGV